MLRTAFSGAPIIGDLLVSRTLGEALVGNVLKFSSLCCAKIFPSPSFGIAAMVASAERPLVFFIIVRLCTGRCIRTIVPGMIVCSLTASAKCKTVLFLTPRLKLSILLVSALNMRTLFEHVCGQRASYLVAKLLGSGPSGAAKHKIPERAP